MTQPPDFGELVGDEGAPEELARLRRVHDLLVAAGPPPELSPGLQAPSLQKPRPSFLPRRRREAAVVLAAAVAAVAFGAGFLVGDRGGDFAEARVVAMRGVGAAKLASASVALGKTDAVGNVPVVMEVRGLKPLGRGWYELLLTKDGKPIAVCGTFAVKKTGVTRVRMSVAYDLKRYDGWVIAPYDFRTHKAGPAMLTT